MQSKVRWFLHEIDPDLRIPSRALRRCKLLDELIAQLEVHAGAVAEIARDLLEDIRSLTRRINVRPLQRHRPDPGLVREQGPQPPQPTSPGHPAPAPPTPPATPPPPPSTPRPTPTPTSDAQRSARSRGPSASEHSRNIDSPSAPAKRQRPSGRCRGGRTATRGAAGAHGRCDGHESSRASLARGESREWRVVRGCRLEVVGYRLLPFQLDSGGHCVSDRARASSLRSGSGASTGLLHRPPENLHLPIQTLRGAPQAT